VVFIGAALNANLQTDTDVVKLLRDAASAGSGGHRPNPIFLFSREPSANALEAVLYWFSVNLRRQFREKEEEFRPSGGDFQGIGIYRSDGFLFGFCGRR